MLDTNNLNGIWLTFEPDERIWDGIHAMLIFVQIFVYICIALVNLLVNLLVDSSKYVCLMLPI